MFKLEIRKYLKIRLYWSFLDHLPHPSWVQGSLPWSYQSWIFLSEFWSFNRPLTLAFWWASIYSRCNEPANFLKGNPKQMWYSHQFIPLLLKDSLLQSFLPSCAPTSPNTSYILQLLRWFLSGSYTEKVPLCDFKLKILLFYFEMFFT